MLIGMDVNFAAYNCSFAGIVKPISISPMAGNTTIMDCIFRNCGQESERACITIEGKFDDGDDEDKMSLTCEGKIFENNNWYPIMNYDTGNKIKGHIFYRDKLYDI